MLERIMSIFRREKEIEEKIEDEVEEKVEQIVEKVKMADREEIESPWDDFKALCKEVGSDYREVVAKAAWAYIEDTGGVDEDPITKAKEVADILKDLSETLDTVTEPESIKKVRMYKEGIKSVAELKNALKDLKSEKLSPTDILAMLKKMGIM